MKKHPTQFGSFPAYLAEVKRDRQIDALHWDNLPPIARAMIRMCFWTVTAILLSIFAILILAIGANVTAVLSDPLAGKPW